MKDYAEFLARKQQAAPAVGIAGATLSKQQARTLFPFQRELDRKGATEIALKMRGRRLTAAGRMAIGGSA